VTNNHRTSQYFQVSRELRQGDPLSSYLFVLYVEILSISIRRNPNIKGIKVDQNEIRIAQYADDTTATLLDIKSAENFLTELENFEKISGLKINKEKTDAMWLGLNKHSNNMPLGIKWSKDPIKYLVFTLDMMPQPYAKRILTPKLKN